MQNRQQADYDVYFTSKADCLQTLCDLRASLDNWKHLQNKAPSIPEIEQPSPL